MVKREPIASLCRRLARSRSFAAIRREFDSNRLYGFVLGSSARLLLLHEEEDFQLDGFIIIRIGDVTHIEPNRSKGTRQRMLDAEGLTAKAGIGLPQKIALGSVRDCLKSLHAHGQSITIEDERDDDERGFRIGKVARLGTNAVAMHYFSPAARWDPKPHMMKYDHITCIQFLNRYLNTYDKYLPPLPGHAAKRTAQL